MQILTWFRTWILGLRRRMVRNDLRFHLRELSGQADQVGEHGLAELLDYVDDLWWDGNAQTANFVLSELVQELLFQRQHPNRVLRLRAHRADPPPNGLEVPRE